MDKTKKKDNKKQEKPKNPMINYQGPRTVTMMPSVVGYKGPGVTIDLKTGKPVKPPKILGVGNLVKLAANKGK